MKVRKVINNSKAPEQYCSKIRTALKTRNLPVSPDYVNTYIILLCSKNFATRHCIVSKIAHPGLCAAKLLYNIIKKRLYFRVSKKKKNLSPL